MSSFNCAVTFAHPTPIIVSKTPSEKLTFPPFLKSRIQTILSSDEVQIMFSLEISLSDKSLKVTTSPANVEILLFDNFILIIVFIPFKII